MGANAGRRRRRSRDAGVGSRIGVRGHGKNGRTITEHARVVIGADGRHSLVAGPVRAEEYQELWADFPKYTYATLWAVVHEFDHE